MTLCVLFCVVNLISSTLFPCFTGSLLACFLVKFPVNSVVTPTACHIIATACPVNMSTWPLSIPPPPVPKLVKMNQTHSHKYTGRTQYNLTIDNVVQKTFYVIFVFVMLLLNCHSPTSMHVDFEETPKWWQSPSSVSADCIEKADFSLFCCCSNKCFSNEERLWRVCVFLCLFNEVSLVTFFLFLSQTLMMIITPVCHHCNPVSQTKSCTNEPQKYSAWSLLQVLYVYVPVSGAVQACLMHTLLH